jgi:hypothetical protein
MDGRADVGSPYVRRGRGFITWIEQQFDPVMAAFEQYLVQPQCGKQFDSRLLEVYLHFP